jgi:hypothetical protein
MKNIIRVLCLGAIVSACSTAAFADVTWTLSDIYFTDGDHATGSFVTNNAGTAVTSYNITVSGPDFFGDFTASEDFTGLLPNEVSFGANGFFFFPYVNLAFASPLTSAGGDVDVAFLNSYLEVSGDSFGVVRESRDFDPDVIGVASAVPEPTSVLLFGTVAGLLVFGLRKKLLPATN